ncbi:MAG TPA: HD domain-containing protein [Alphaproteobacteria bacterium]|nr:HD domain-containing protein [Alphaproteobacteria bacterium]
MADLSRLEQIHDFLILTDRFKQVVRQNYLTDGSRRETDAEHTWHMALYALLLKDELGVEVDIGRTLALILVHDLVEIYAGDTFAYDDVGRADQEEREREAAAKLFGMLPPDLRDRVDSWWREFEEGRTNEARFARALDRLQAFGQNVVSRGKSWHEHGVTRARTFGRMNEALESDPAIRALVERLYRRADTEGSWVAEPAGT